MMPGPHSAQGSGQRVHRGNHSPLVLKRSLACTTVALLWPVLASCVLAQVELEEIPPFRPPKPELPPTFWEQNGLWVVLGIAAVLAVVVLVWRLLANRPPPPPPTPAETARMALAALAAEPIPACSRQGVSAPLPTRPGARRLKSAATVGEELPDQVSAILRTYFVAVLSLPAQALTHRELAAALRSQSKLCPEPATKAITLLEALDGCRFDPQANTAIPDAVQRAMELVELTESALQPPPAAAAAVGKSPA